jgi:hypothetical protein
MAEWTPIADLVGRMPMNAALYGEPPAPIAALATIRSEDAMPCPTCGSEDTIPLPLTKFDNFVGTAHVCDSCLNVWSVMSDVRTSTDLWAASHRRLRSSAPPPFVVQAKSLRRGGARAALP